jgi:hypothetical protein
VHRRQAQREHRASALSVGDGNVAPVGLRDLPDDRKAKPRPRQMSSTGRTPEAVENM